MATSPSEVPTDPYFPIGPAFYADPYPHYARLRAEDPVRWSDFMGTWIVSRDADVAAGARDPRLSSRRLSALLGLMPPAAREAMNDLTRIRSREIDFLDPPDHTRVRGLVNKAFTPRMVESLRPRVQALVDRILDAAAAADHLDVIRDLAYPVPATVIMEMMGVPLDDREKLKAWSNDFQQLVATGRPTAASATIFQRSMLATMDYFRGLIERRRKQPASDLLSALVAAEEHGDFLGEDEMLILCVFLLTAGHETTTNLIGNGLLALLRHPGQLARLRADPSLIGSAVEELLRFDAPVQRLSRLVVEDLSLGEKQLKKGQLVWLMLAAANRDPAQLPDPDRLDVARPNNRHLAFNVGAHFCLGAPLARLEGQVVFDTLLHRFPALRLATDEVEWTPNMQLRGLKTLPVVF